MQDPLELEWEEHLNEMARYLAFGSIKVLRLKRYLAFYERLSADKKSEFDKTVRRMADALSEMRYGKL